MAETEVTQKELLAGVKTQSDELQVCALDM